MSWFDGPEVQESRAQEFVSALRSAGESGAFPGVDPADTVVGLLEDPSGPGLTVGVAVPKLTTQRRWLLVSFEPGPLEGAPMLQSAWSSHLSLSTEPGAHDGPDGSNDLWVSGIAAGPTEFAAWVIAWVGRQLRRPVTRREWDQPATGPGAGLLGRARSAAATEWWLSNPEEYLDSRGTFGRWRLTRLAPSREIRERP